MKSETKKPAVPDLPAKRPEIIKGGAGKNSEQRQKQLQ
jgi:hypothetical protein